VRPESVSRVLSYHGCQVARCPPASPPCTDVRTRQGDTGNNDACTHELTDLEREFLSRPRRLCGSSVRRGHWPDPGDAWDASRPRGGLRDAALVMWFWAQRLGVRLLGHPAVQIGDANGRHFRLAGKPHVPAFSARICRRGHAVGRAEQDDRDCPWRGLCLAAATRSPGEQSYVFTRLHSDIKTPILGISDRYLRGVP